jgi:3D (Asp-Asp-Asp) domain-containing protein
MHLSFRIIIYNKDIKIIYMIYLKFITIKGNKLDIVLSKGHKALKFGLVIIKKIIVKTSIPEA